MYFSHFPIRLNRVVLAALFVLLSFSPLWAQTQKPVLHGKHWVAITGKPLGATAGAKIFLIYHMIQFIAMHD